MHARRRILGPPMRDADRDRKNGLATRVRNLWYKVAPDLRRGSEVHCSPGGPAVSGEAMLYWTGALGSHRYHACVYLDPRQLHHSYYRREHASGSIEWCTAAGQNHQLRRDATLPEFLAAFAAFIRKQEGFDA